MPTLPRRPFSAFTSIGRFASRRPARRPSRTFVPVRVVESHRRDCSPLEVITPSGMRIRVAVDFNPEHLRRVIKALESGC